MRRPIRQLATVSFLAASLVGCADTTNSTGPPAKARSEAVAPPPGSQLTAPRTGLGPNDFVEIVAGEFHTCARKLSRQVYCWGRNNYGQTGAVPSQPCVNFVPCTDRPRLVFAGGDTISATLLDAGTDHTCALDGAGAAWCWGDGRQGQLGIGFSTPFGQPTRVAGGLSFSSIGAGSSSSCGTTNGGMYCWGAFVGASQPALVSSYNVYESVAVGDRHACTMAVMGTYRAVDCWGDNHYGQLGNDPVQLPVGPFTVRAQFGTSVNRVSTQYSATCVDQSNGTVQCVGDTGWSQLGLPSSTWRSGVPQTIGRGQQLHGVSMGAWHGCALDVNEAAWCWGRGFYGELGDGGKGSITPVAVLGGRTYRAMASGGQHTCGIATDNHIYCWGYNDFGQLGAQRLNSWIGHPVQVLDP